MERATIRVEGTVQGVGFRMLVKNNADRLRLKGQVKNLHDLTVEVICEGERDNIESLIKMIETFKDTVKVEKVTTTYSAPTGEYDTFSVVMGDVNMELMSGILTASLYLENISTDIKHIRKSQEDMSVDIKHIRKSQEDMSVDIKHIRKSQDEMSADIKHIRKSQDEMSADIKHIRKSQDEMSADIKHIRKSQEDMSVDIKHIRKSQEDMSVDIKHIRKVQESGFRSVNERQEDMISAIREQTHHIQDSSLRLTNLEQKVEGKILRPS